jgi:hypothetical protein
MPLQEQSVAQCMVPYSRHTILWCLLRTLFVGALNHSSLGYIHAMWAGSVLQQQQHMLARCIICGCLGLAETRR